MSERTGANLQDLVGAALRDGLDLARKEFALFRAEMSENIGDMARGLIMFAAAAVFAVASLIWLTQALVYGLEIVTGSRWVSALIVGGLLLLIAVALVIVGKNRLSASTLVPTRTARSLKRDADVLTERVPT